MVKKVADEIMERGDDKLEDVITKPGEYVGKFSKSKKGKAIGGWAFIIGFLIALVAGLIAGLNAAGVTQIDIAITGGMTGFLVLLGIVIGLVNVTTREAISFLVATIAIMAGSAGFGALSAIGLGAVAAFLTGLVSMLAVFVAPAAIIVALKVIYSTAREA
ncbi:MAG: hypothetical protein JXB14_03695 [Candidatus Altiarchaeota archaeon]|nr:hypothetical protein [Candidatus Altiarchaeota archaeon]